MARTIDTIPNPRAFRIGIMSAWVVLSATSMALALGRGGDELRASIEVKTVAEAGGQRVFVLQNDGKLIWRRARLWLDDRYYIEGVGVAPGTAWRFTGGDLIDLQSAPLALADPFYVGLDETGPPRRASQDVTFKLARLRVGPDVLELAAAEQAEGAHPGGP